MSHISSVKTFRELSKLVKVSEPTPQPIEVEEKVSTSLVNQAYIESWNLAIVPIELRGVKWFKQLIEKADAVVIVNQYNYVEIERDPKGLLDDKDVWYATVSAASTFSTRIRNYLWGKAFRNTKGILEKSGIDTNRLVESGCYNFDKFFPEVK